MKTTLKQLALVTALLVSMIALIVFYAVKITSQLLYNGTIWLYDQIDYFIIQEVKAVNNFNM